MSNGEVARPRRKPLSPHWYRRYIRECPVCGHSTEERFRMFTPKPEDPRERIEYDGMAYDYCDV
jgi:hypothetical protein